MLFFRSVHPAVWTEGKHALPVGERASVPGAKGPAKSADRGLTVPIRAPPGKNLLKISVLWNAVPSNVQFAKVPATWQNPAGNAAAKNICSTEKNCVLFILSSTKWWKPSSNPRQVCKGVQGEGGSAKHLPQSRCCGQSGRSALGSVYVMLSGISKAHGPLCTIEHIRIGSVHCSKHFIFFKKILQSTCLSARNLL